MPVYKYEAIRHGGQRVSETIEAETDRDARRKLRQDDLYVTRLVPASFTQRRGIKLSRIKQFDRKRAAALEAITRQLALLLDNEVKLTDALNITLGEVTDKRLVAVLQDVRDRVANGSSVAEAMDAHRWLFGQMYISMVRVGETAGTLPEVLRRMADYMRERIMRQGQMGIALIYPVFLLGALAIILTILMKQVFPNIQELFESLGRELPLPTQILIGAYEFVSGNIILLGIAAIGLISALVSFLRTEKGRRTRDRLFLRLPVVSDLVRKTQTVQFTGTLRTLLGSGVKMADSMTVLRDISTNTLMKDTITELQEGIMRGSDVSTVLRRSRIIPGPVAHMVAVGEQSGELETVLARMTENLNAEVEMSVQRLTALMTPIVMLIMIVLVGFVVIATMLPMLQMGSAF